MRNFLIDGSVAEDIDLCSPMPSDALLPYLEDLSFKVLAHYKRTGTVLFSDGRQKYEFTSWRKEKYRGGEHTPYATEHTDDIFEDACRRDFKCNAVYYDIKNEKFVDVLGGIKDIENKILDTVKDPDKVFCSDGLRLMRLARFSGELDFTPPDKVLESAKKYAVNIKDISPERVFSELKMILVADTKYPFSNKRGHYKALKVLDDTRVLDQIIPELTKGRYMAQRADYHKFDVLEHSLRTVLYSDKSIRLSALLHDIGKPYCMEKYGRFHFHYAEGEWIATDVLKRLKADNKTIETVRYMVREHMVDLNCKMSEKDVRHYLVRNIDMIDDLIRLKKADYKAGLESESPAPTVVKWKKIYEKMRSDGTPFGLKQLNITAENLKEIGFKGNKIGLELNSLLDFAIDNPHKNKNEILFVTAKKDYDILSEN